MKPEKSEEVGRLVASTGAGLNVPLVMRFTVLLRLRLDDKLRTVDA